jgi:oligopeptidase A
LRRSGGLAHAAKDLREMSSTDNPLLDFSGLPRFASIRAEHVAPAIQALLAEGRSVIARVQDSSMPPTWEGFIQPLEAVNERISRTWGTVGHLHAVLDSPELRAAYSDNQPAVVQYHTELGQNLAVFEKYRALRSSPAFDALSTAQRRIVDNEIRDFRLSGAELPGAAKERFAAIQEELARLNTKFSENVLDATNAFTVFVEDPAELAGVPEDALAAARAAAAREGRPGWKLTLQAPCYLAIIQYAHSRALRELMYHGYVTRASDEFEQALARRDAYERRHASAAGRAAAPHGARAGDWDNTAIIDRILALRREAALLLGYRSYAELSVVPKMAESPQQVLGFLDELAQKARPFARHDYEELQQFAGRELGIAELEAWDVAWASERLRTKRFAFSEQELKQYFPQEKVLEGMFRAVEKLYGVRIEPDSAQVWDPTVRFFCIRSAVDGALLGSFYLDPYSRETKRGGAWMDEALTRHRTEKGVQLPVAYLVCNFSAPVAGNPALMTHDDVVTLFHEFGHGLHHLLTRVDYIGVSGIRGVEWDAIELPSQFMENFCWEWDVLQTMSCYTGAGDMHGRPLPRELCDKLLAARNFQSGMQMVRQLEFALFDMHLHHDFEPGGAGTPMDVLERVRRQVAVFQPPPYYRLANSFSHVFAGAAYAAGYYSYKWAEVLSADAYSAFEEHRTSGNGVLDASTGRRFLEEILHIGGSRPAIESFKAFRGREPRADALLRHNGMISEQSHGERASAAPAQAVPLGKLL